MTEPLPPAAPQAATVTVADFFADGRIAGELLVAAGHQGFARRIAHPRVQKSGLAFAGHFHGLSPRRVQVVGETEQTYLAQLSPDLREKACNAFFSQELSCVVVTRIAHPLDGRDNETIAALLKAADASGTPVFVGAARSSATINIVHAVLDDLLAPTTRMHGVLVDVFGVGLLLLGKSGIGKSECALELVLRGHRLVADDVVQIDWRPPGMVFGSPAELLKNHIEIRGLGILNVKDLFGVTAVRDRKRIDIVTQLVEWRDGMTVDRLGVDDHFQTILGTPVRELTVPVQPGRDMGSILEIAARNELLRRAGKHSAREFVARLSERSAKREGSEPARPPTTAPWAPRRFDTLNSLKAAYGQGRAPEGETAPSSSQADAVAPRRHVSSVDVPPPPSSAHAFRPVGLDPNPHVVSDDFPSPLDPSGGRRGRDDR